MPDITNSANGERRSNQTHKKSVYLTEFGRERISTWASENNLNFSAAIETLALMGLDDARADYAIPALRATTLQGLRQVFKRFLHITSQMALDASAARLVSESIMLQMIRQAAEQHQERFEAVLPVPPNSTDPLDQRIRQMHNRIKQAVQEQSVHKLKESSASLQALFDEES